MLRRIAEFLRAVSAHRWYPLGLALFAVVLMWSSLGSGLFQDDLTHRAKLLGVRCLPEKYYGTPLLPEDSGTLSSAMRDMFAVARNPEEIRRLRDLGVAPWWTFEGLRISNWRPLTALTHWVDYRLFPETLWLMHLHSVAWFALVVFLLVLWYRRIMGAIWVAGFAAFLYVVDESNHFPVSWLANRNLLMALVFSIGTLLCHDRARRQGDKVCGLGAPLLLLLALLSTEAAIATSAYLFAYALVLDDRTRMRRLLSLAPYVAIIVGWRIVYNALGHGASGGGFVIDPGREPVAFAWAVLQRAPTLLAAQWSPLAADVVSVFSNYAQRRLLYWTYAFVLLVGAVLIPLLKRDRVSRFWAVGMLLCVVPICATVPMNRNLLFVAIGGFGLVARYITGVMSGAAWVPTGRLSRAPIWIVCVVLLCIHVPGALAGRGLAPRMFAFGQRFFNGSVDIGEAPDLSSKKVIVVNAPHPFMFIALPYLRNYEGRSLPEANRVLVPGFRELELTRTGERTLVMCSKNGSLLSIDRARKDKRPSLCYFYQVFNSLFRGPGEVFAPGERVELPDMSMEVISVARDGFPDEVRFEFAMALDDPSLHWLWWQHHGDQRGYQRFEIPPVGEGVTLAGPF